MFTGIVETTTTILQKSETGLVLERPTMFDDITIGCSISVSGVCLSVVTFDDESMSFDVVKETWDKTNLGDKQEGDEVNVERSVPATGRFEGHVVQGHVEGTGTLLEMNQDGKWTMMKIELPDVVQPFAVYKGAIAIDGVSLTVAAVENETCTIALIPHTLEITSFKHLKNGDRVNIETDVFARYCSALLKREKTVS